MTAKAPIRTALRVAAVLFLLGSLFLLLRPEPTTGFAALEADGFGAGNFADAVVQREKALAVESERVGLQPDSWLAREREAMARYNLGKLRGDFAAMSEAYRLLEAANAMAPANSGPALSSAMLAFAMHKLDETEQALDSLDGRAVRASAGERSEVLGLRGDLAFYRGDYARARSLYREALSLDSHPGLHVRLANWHQRMGDLEASLTAFDDAAKSAGRASPELASTLLLYAGGAHLKRGNWEEAIDLFERADAVFPGYWLTQAHLAQMDAATGDLDAAAQRYRAILSDHDEPSVMAAFAPVLEAQGKSREAAAMAQQAEAIFAARARDFPEAFADHVLDGALSAGDLDAAIAAARSNHAGRPYGDSKVGVARAMIATGQAERARVLLDTVHRSGWRSTEQYLATAAACEKIGDAACVSQARRRAKDFNRMAMADGSDFLAFGNH